MSCHNIGHALNTVVEFILSEYDKGNLDYETAHKLVNKSRDAVHYCDGNTYEALECFKNEGRCTCCFEKTDNLLKVYELPDSLQHLSKNLESVVYGDKLLGGYICMTCANKLGG